MIAETFFVVSGILLISKHEGRGFGKNSVGVGDENREARFVTIIELGKVLARGGMLIFCATGDESVI